LLDYPYIVFTEHQSNIFNGLKSSDRVLRWLFLLEEYGVAFKYLPGEKNIVADALSRLDIDDLKTQEEVSTLPSQSEHRSITFSMHTVLIFKDKTRQDKTRVKGLRQKNYLKPYYSTQHIKGYDLLCLLCNIDKIYILQSSRQKQKVLSWYHEYLLHTGKTCTEKTVRNIMTWPGLTQDVESLYSTCQDCQSTKNKRKKCGLLPLKVAQSDPWVSVWQTYDSKYCIQVKTEQNPKKKTEHN
jgi:Integrase zinc binding domain